MKVIKKHSKVPIILGWTMFVLLLIFSTLWIIKSTQEAVRVSDSLSELAEDQTGQTSEKQDTKETVVESTISDNPSTPTYPITLSAEEVSSEQVVVNKKHRLPADYEPVLASVRGGRMRQNAATALEKLFVEAEKSGLGPLLVSSYRSYAAQEQVYEGYVARDGQELADTYSARPGHSEHQTGLAVDVDDGSGCQLETCFGNTAFGKWLEENSHTYGFIIRYPSGMEMITGYQYEPWHLRYVGIETATAVYEQNITLDQYFNKPAGSY